LVTLGRHEEQTCPFVHLLHYRSGEGEFPMGRIALPTIVVIALIVIAIMYLF
jgi:hypothetical protein